MCSYTRGNQGSEDVVHRNNSRPPVDDFSHVPEGWEGSPRWSLKEPLFLMNFDRWGVVDVIGPLTHDVGEVLRLLAHPESDGPANDWALEHGLEVIDHPNGRTVFSKVIRPLGSDQTLDEARLIISTTS